MGVLSYLEKELVWMKKAKGRRAYDASSGVFNTEGKRGWKGLERGGKFRVYW